MEKDWCPTCRKPFVYDIADPNGVVICPHCDTQHSVEILRVWNNGLEAGIEYPTNFPMQDKGASYSIPRRDLRTDAHTRSIEDNWRKNVYLVLDYMADVLCADPTVLRVHQENIRRVVFQVKKGLEELGALSVKADPPPLGRDHGPVE